MAPVLELAGRVKPEIGRLVVAHAGVSRRVIEHFSRRRAEILEHMAQRGEHSAAAAQVAALETRRRPREWLVGAVNIASLTTSTPAVRRSTCNC